MESMVGLLLAGSLVVLLIAGVLAILFYVLFSIGSMKVLKAQGFAHPWVAWIPFVCFVALGYCCDEGDGNVTIIGLKLPTIIFSLWIILSIAVGYLPNVGNLASLIVQILFLGRTFQVLYSRMENKPEKDTAIVGYLSGWLPIIGMVKFLSYKER